MSTLRNVIVVGVLLLAGMGCSTYSYLDFEVKLDPSFSSITAQSISHCHMFVTGAVTDDFTIPELRDDKTALCPPNQGTTDITRVNYSTFAESGDVTFTLNAYTGSTEKPDCLFAQGATTMKIAKGETTKGSDLKLAATPGAVVCQ
jgi:hypothetical protein